MANNVEGPEEDMKNVFIALNLAKKEGLETEVITWAFYAMKANSQLSIEEALSSGIGEWIK